MENNDTCLTCQTFDRRNNGEDVPQVEINRANLWGCTCDPEAAAEAEAFIALVTR
jgi:hypothetical protein